MRCPSLIRTMQSTNQQQIPLAIVNRLSVFLIILIISADANAQKLPNVQKSSLRAPENIKIDGNLVEWGNKFQAYNNATDLFYTMANNDENLYLVIRTKDLDELVKITSRGIIFNISKNGKKYDKDAMSITYPFFEMGHKPFIQFGDITAMPRYQREAMDRNPDSVSKVANKKLQDNEKYIRANNIPGVDTLLSIYNRDGIKAAEAFDSTMAYTCELAIPLHLLNLDLKSNSAFAYHIILAGLTDDDFGFKTTTDANGHFHMSAAPGAAFVKKEHLDAVSSTTDFSGEYTLAKK